MNNGGVTSHGHAHRGHHPLPADTRPVSHDAVGRLPSNSPLPEDPKMDTRHSSSSKTPLEESAQKSSYEKNHVLVVKVSPTMKPGLPDVPQSLLWQRVLVEHSYCKRLASNQTIPSVETGPAPHTSLQTSDKNARIILSASSTSSSVHRAKRVTQREEETKVEEQQYQEEEKVKEKTDGEEEQSHQEEDEMESVNGEEPDEETYRTPSNSSGFDDFNLDLDSEAESITSASLVSEPDDSFHRTGASSRESLMKVSIPKKYYQQQSAPAVSTSVPSPSSSVTSDSSIRLRNGRVLPATNRLYLFASRKGPKRKLEPDLFRDDGVIEIPDDEKTDKSWESKRETSSEGFDEDSVIKITDPSSDDSLVEEPLIKRRKRRPFYTTKAVSQKELL